MMLQSVRCASCAILLASSLATLSPLVAQEELSAASVVLDALLDERESEIDAEAMEKLSQLMAEPLNLQEADDEALRALPLLPTEFLERLIAWRNAGTIRSYAELHAIAGMTEENLRLLKAMTRLRDPDPRQRGSVRLRTRSTVDAHDLEMYGQRLSIAQKSDQRFTLTHGSKGESISVLGDLRIEKDPGERRWNDLVSGHLTVAERSTGLRAVLGTFRLGHADGILVRRTSMLSGGNDAPAQFVRRATGVRGSASSDVQSVFRGIAVGWRMAGVAIEGFISEKPIHANVDERGVITSLYGSDIFRTESEMRKRNAARERGYGARMECAVIPGLNIGAAMLLTTLSRPTALSIGPQSAGGISIGMQYAGERLTWTMEGARDLDRNVSWRSAGALSLGQRMTIGVAIHSYSPHFSSRFGGGASLKQDRSQNEAGISFAVHVRPTEAIELGITGVRAVFAELGDALQTDLHASSLRGFLLARLTRRTTMEINARDRRQEELRSQNDGLGTPALGEARRRSIQWILRTMPVRSLRMTTRLDLVRSSVPGGSSHTTAARVMQEVRFQWNDALSVAARAAYYDVDRYDARLYDVAPDLPGTSGFQLHLGEGTQWTIVASVRIVAGLACSAKYMQTDALPLGDGSRLIPRPVVHSEGGLQIEATIPIP